MAFCSLQIHFLSFSWMVAHWWGQSAMKAKKKTKHDAKKSVGFPIKFDKNVWSTSTNAWASMKHLKRLLSRKALKSSKGLRFIRPFPRYLTPCHLLLIKQIICLRYLTNISDIAGKDHFATAMTVAESILIGVQFLPTLIPVRNTISRS